jgi:hypothetical protein
MRTDHLIAALAQDARLALPWWQRPAVVLSAGAALSVAAFALVMPVRGDLLAQHAFAPTAYKWILAGGLALLGGRVALGLRQPGAKSPLLRVVAGLFAGLLLVTLAYDLAVHGSSGFFDRLFGSSAMMCLQSVGWLSLAPLAAVFLVLRAGAVTSPATAGFAAGLASAGFAAALYALKCTEDNALFVVTWYSLAAFLVGLVAMFIGRWFLRW